MSKMLKIKRLRETATIPTRAHAVIARVELWTPVECNSLSETDRGASGFGSSGK